MNMEQNIRIATIPVDQLEEIIKRVVKSVLPQQTENIKNQDVELLTRAEAAKFLRISLPTLHKITQEGGLKYYQPGSKILYSKKEILKYVERFYK